MWHPFKRGADTAIQPLIDAVTSAMHRVGPDAPEYAGYLKTLEKLQELKNDERPEPISLDTILLVLGNLAGILIIVMYENKHVLRSVAVNQLIRLRGT